MSGATMSGATMESVTRGFAPSVTMQELAERLAGAWTPGRALVLDVRSRAEYVLGHVPGAYNAPMEDLQRSPWRVARALPAREVVFVHCTKGVRSARAVRALHDAGVGDVVLVRDSGFPEWKELGFPVERGLGRSLRLEDPRSFARAAAAGIGAGMVATIASGIANAGLSFLVSDEQQRRERRVRRGSPHEVGGALFFERLRGRRPSGGEKLVAALAFGAFYGVVMGLAYTVVRRAMPGSTRSWALPLTAGAFFGACDGVIAPTLGLTPGLARLPWQVNAKELANHVVWNATAERIHRADERVVEASGAARGA